MTDQSCASNGCPHPRAAGRFLCAEHLALVAAHSTPEQIAERERRDAQVHQAVAAAARVSRGQGQLICPHCQTRGSVRTHSVKHKRGVSGGKATGALLTGGLSLFATGLSRKERATECHCGNCGMTWRV